LTVDLTTISRRHATLTCQSTNSAVIRSRTGEAMSPNSRNTSILIAALGLWVANLLGCGSGGDAVSPPDQSPTAVDSLILNLESADVTIGDTVRLVAIATDAEGLPVPGVTLVWSSSNQSVATVSSEGLVTAVAEGEAEIGVDVAGASQVLASSSNAQFNLTTSQVRRGRSRAKIIVVPQAACNGALGVKKWDALFELSYQATGSHIEETMSVSTGSSATAHLTLAGKNSTQADWIGEVTGTARIDNISTHPDNLSPENKLYTLKEKADAPLSNISPSTVHLHIGRDSFTGTCFADVTYVEQTTWTQTRTYLGSESVTGSFGMATVSSGLGAKPQGGWVIGAAVNLLVRSQIEDPELPVLPHSSYYVPASAVAVALVEAMGTQSGSANLTYSITAAK
jgi:Bacterial Ig-like domain (group 2)